MKTLIVVVLSVALAGLAFAGNTATANQNGQNNVATITQTGNNSATVNQTGSNHIAEVTQDGSNTATVDQVKTDYTYYTSATNAKVTQKGTNNIADVDQFKGAYGGNANFSKAIVDQDGADNLATIKQNVNDHADAAITQKGNSNEALIEQISNTSWATIHQEGTDNYGKQYLWTVNSYADIKQIGDRNEATQTTLTPPVKLSKFYAEQIGDDNKATQTIKGSAWGYANGNNQELLYQTGDFNVGTQVHEGVGGVGADFNLSTITQTGDLNTATTTQLGDHHTATVTQIGNSNNATVFQSN